MIVLFNDLDGPWEQVRGSLKTDLEHIQTALNSFEDRTIHVVTRKILASALPAATGVTAGVFGAANSTVVISVDETGRIISIEEVPISLTLNETFLTEGSEIGSLPNSRRLTAGTGVSFDDSTPNQRVVNVTPIAVPTLDDISDVLAAGPANGDIIKYVQSAGHWQNFPQATQVVTFTEEGHGVALAGTGIRKYISAPCSGTINRVRVMADQAGAVVLDIWRDSWGNSPPTVADTIIVGTKPNLSATQFYEDTTLGGWNTTVTEGDVFGIAIDSVATITWVALEIFIRPS